MTFSARTGLTALAAAAAMTGQAGAVEKGEILSTYGDIAHAAYEDSLITAKRLGDAVDALIASPSPLRLKPRAPPGSRPACPICRPRFTASAIRWWTHGKAR